MRPVGVELCEHRVPVRHPHLDAVEHSAGSVRCGDSPRRSRISSRTGMPSASGSTVFCTSSESRNSSSFFADVLVRRALGDTGDVGHRDGRALAVGAGREEDLELRAVVLDRVQVHLHIAVGDQQLTVADLGLQLAGRRRRTDIVGLQLRQVVERARLAEQLLQQDQHRGAVAGLARCGVLQLALVLRRQQVVPGLRLRVGARVDDEAERVVDDRHVVAVGPTWSAGMPVGVDAAGHQQPGLIGLLDERRQRDQQVGLRVRLLLLHPRHHLA